jgi:hypothetical protein
VEATAPSRADPDAAAAVVRRTIDPASAAEVVRPALQAELRERPYSFDIQVQLRTDLERMPVDDTTVEWPERLSPTVTVAEPRLPQQDISCPENLEKMDSLSFTPWRATAEHAALGNITRARKEVYRRSSSNDTDSTSKNGVSLAALTRYRTDGRGPSPPALRTPPSRAAVQGGTAASFPMRCAASSLTVRESPQGLARDGATASATPSVGRTARALRTRSAWSSPPSATAVSGSAHRRSRA